MAIQVVVSLSDKKVAEREIQSLMDASNDLNIHHLLILTEDKEEMKTVGDREVRILPIWKWLLIK